MATLREILEGLSCGLPASVSAFLHGSRRKRENSVYGNYCDGYFAKKESRKRLPSSFSDGLENVTDENIDFLFKK